MIIERFKGTDLAEIDVQDAQLEVYDYASDVVPFYESGPAYTMRSGQRVLACWGLIWTTKGGHLWAILAKDAPLISLHRAARRGLSAYSDVRVTASVVSGFVAGCRWLEMLGFERGPLAEKFDPAGNDHFIYVREPA